MSSSSSGSDAFAIFAILIISALVLLLLRHYLPLRTSPAYLLLPVFLALALPSSIIVLVPIDLASASGTDTEGARGIWLPYRVLLVTWRITYWLTFALTWAILPLLGEYSDSGHRDPKARLVYSLRSNGRYQLIVLGAGILGAVYIFLQYGFHTDTVKGLVMALAYAWGLVLAIYLMGHGLVAIPRRLFRDASLSGRLRRLEACAPKAHDKLEEANEELNSIEAQVVQLRQRKTGMSGDLQDWIEELNEPSRSAQARPSVIAPRSAGSGVPAVVTERYLADVARKLKRARHRKIRFTGEWLNLVQQAADLQTILDSSSSKRLDFGRPRHGVLSRISPVTPFVRYHLYTHIYPFGRLALGSFLALASVLLIWSELVHQWTTKLSVVGLTVIHHPSSSRGKIGFPGQLIAAAWLLYMCTAALYSVSEVKVWGNRALVKRQTYSESACWYSLQVAKLTVPLSYNFITMMPPNIYKETAFFKFLGQLINLTPLGSGFSEYFPIFVLLPVCATLFNLYGKVKNVVGFGVIEDESDENTTGFGTGGWREGRALIERELQNDNTQLGLSATGTNARRTDTSEGTSTLPPNTAREGRAPLLPYIESRTPAQAQSRTPNDLPEEDTSERYFFQDFGERVRNTFDTVEQPGWIKDIGQAFKKPKWMSDDPRDDSGGSALGRWFGGRPSDGRLRL